MAGEVGGIGPGLAVAKGAPQEPARRQFHLPAQPGGGPCQGRTRIAAFDRLVGPGARAPHPGTTGLHLDHLGGKIRWATHRHASRKQRGVQQVLQLHGVRLWCQCLQDLRGLIAIAEL